MGLLLLQLHLHQILFHYRDWIMTRLCRSLILQDCCHLHSSACNVPPTHIIAASQSVEMCFEDLLHQQNVICLYITVKQKIKDEFYTEE